METDHLISPLDLVGCRYRQVQKRRHPGIEAPESSHHRRRRLETAREVVFGLFPERPEIGDNRHFFRIDLPEVSPELSAWSREDVDKIDEAYLFTLEALAAGAHFITNPVLEGVSAGIPWYVRVDALVRRKSGAYYPVLVTNHRVARPDPRRRVKVVATSRLGLGNSGWANYKLKSHAVDSYTLALASRALDELGLGCQRGGLIGQDRQLTFLLDTDMLQQGLDRALEVPVPTEARRIKECGACRFWPVCREELEARDDISLFLPGDRSRAFREEGITTVASLVDAKVGEPSVLAAAWRDGVHFLRRREDIEVPRFDREIDLDVEAYLDQGAYLWGTYDGEQYYPFVTWEGVGGGEEAEGRNFARLWRWLAARREEAAAAGESVGVFCYAANGENHWLRFSARRFFDRVEGVPSPEEVEEFIGSGHWIDVFVHVKQNLAGTSGLGLKQVGPAAGFHWEAEDVDGEESVNIYREATGLEVGADVAAARQRLLGYNRDDCRATRAVREWLGAGAPGAPLMTL